MKRKQQLIHLQPGEIYFSKTNGQVNEVAKIRTILGSCVSITVWHPTLLIGGMCHYLLAQQSRSTLTSKVLKQYRYGDRALDFLLIKMSLIQPINNFELGVFGGGCMYDRSVSPSIGEINVAFAHAWAKRNKLAFTQEDTLGNLGRNLKLDLVNGNIELSKYPIEQEDL
ncbi:MAG: chemotaxis protein CheD [Colwellia sp.]|nr:chemotaxis protein CheD [Colwellia sp.]